MIFRKLPVICAVCQHKSYLKVSRHQVLMGAAMWEPSEVHWTLLRWVAKVPRKARQADPHTLANYTCYHNRVQRYTSCHTNRTIIIVHFDHTNDSDNGTQSSPHLRWYRVGHINYITHLRLQNNKYEQRDGMQ